MQKGWITAQSPFYTLSDHLEYGPRHTPVNLSAGGVLYPPRLQNRFSFPNAAGDVNLAVAFPIGTQPVNYREIEQR